MVMPSWFQVLSAAVTRYGIIKGVMAFLKDEPKPEILYVLSRFSGGSREIGPIFRDRRKAGIAARQSGSLITEAFTADHLVTGDD